jgi:hypothetical protein
VTGARGSLRSVVLVLGTLAGCTTSAPTPVPIPPPRAAHPCDYLTENEVADLFGEPREEQRLSPDECVWAVPGEDFATGPWNAVELHSTTGNVMACGGKQPVAGAGHVACGDSGHVQFFAGGKTFSLSFPLLVFEETDRPSQRRSPWHA